MPKSKTKSFMGMKPNTVIQYKGGGYDGCFWEWNYGFVNPNGQFEDISSTGHFGCPTAEKMARHIQIERDFELFCLDNPEDRDRLGRTCPISHLMGLSQWFTKRDTEFLIEVECDCCGEKVRVQQMRGENPHGIGGIMSEYGDFVCFDCDSQYSCHYCGEFMGKNHEFDPETGYCKYCAER